MDLGKERPMAKDSLMEKDLRHEMACFRLPLHNNNVFVNRVFVLNFAYSNACLIGKLGII